MAGIIVHSLTKKGMDEAAPELTSLRGEAGVSFDSDLVTFLTPFVKVSAEDGNIPSQDRDNLVTLRFGKGRELENPRKYIHMVKSPNYPQFLEYTAMKAPNNGRDYADWTK